jgi:hypothetical protein
VVGAVAGRSVTVAVKAILAREQSPISSTNALQAAVRSAIPRAAPVRTVSSRVFMGRKRPERLHEALRRRRRRSREPSA